MRQLSFLFFAGLFTILTGCAGEKQEAQTEMAIKADADNAGLVVPEGFSVLMVADSVGAARHLVVNKMGDIFVKLREPKGGAGIIMLAAEDGDGRGNRRKTAL